jgi:acyl-CoA thioesterase I
MASPSLVRSLTAITAVLTLGVATLSRPPHISDFVRAASAAQPSAQPECHASADLVRFTHPLPRTAQRLAAGEPLTIVAIGSSSTAGVGASSPDASYPSRLAADLQQMFPRTKIKMINRGVNGEEVPDMLARFQSEVIDEKPDLVLWQLGTNAVLRDDPLKPADSLVRRGIRELKASGADVVLIDPQFTQRVIAKPEIEGMVNLLAGEAKAADVDLFARFAVMRGWHEKDGLPFEKFSAADDLHMNDWGYACIAQLLSTSIADVTERSILSARATSVVHSTTATH